MNIVIRQFALLSLGLLLGNSAVAVAPVGGPQSLLTLPHVPNQLLVKRQPGVPVEAIEQFLDCVTGILIESSGPAGLDVVAIDVDANLGDALLLLNGNPALIASADLNYIAQLSATPNDLEFSQQWAKENTGLNGPSGIGHPGADLNLVAGWDTQADAPGVILAVIDDSVDTTHIDLVGNIMSSGRCYASPNSARPCVNGPNDPNPVDAEDFHGTWVAGIAGAEGNNGIGIAGTAWDIDLLPLKVDLSHFAIVQAIDEAIAQGADIINMSFGGPVESQALSDAISRAEQAGILIVAAAGNADGNNAFASSYPANAVQSNVLSVAASTSRDRIASFSQWGSTTVDLAAPGESV
ncbi:MAG: S8 family serine peptidase, partial [Gammaproteobacteria bacterium]|nr:S8 family serine peptidase [Gammaproteobacteria bacterium]